MVVGEHEAQNAVRILITEPIAREGIDLLRSELPAVQIDVRPGLTPKELHERIGNYSVLIVRSATRVTDELLAAARELKVVGRAGTGVDNIDLEAATRRGIVVVNAPRGNVVAAAEHTIALLLALARHIPAANSSLKAGRWEKSRYLGREVWNKVLSIIGLGKVGREVAWRAHGLGMRVLAYDPYVSAEQADDLGVALLSMEEALQHADVVTLHASLTNGPNGTRWLLGARELSLLKPDALLINCARGGLVDEAALLVALEERRIAGAALDVFSQEPICDNEVLQRLLAHERVIATPHLGASTAEAQVRVATEVARHIVTVLREDRLPETVHTPLLLTKK